MLGRAFVWPIILVAVALLTAAALLLFVVQPVSEPAADAERVDDPAPRERVSGSGFGETDFISSGGGNAGAFGAATQGAEIEEAEEPMQPWELAINRLLDSDDENDKVAAELAALVPTMPLEGQVEAIQHVVNLLEDSQYGLASNMLLNPGVHPDLREVLWSDVLDRPNGVKLPVLLSLMTGPGHPSRPEAHLKLQEALGKDFGVDAALWAAPVQAFLAREAEEEAKDEEETAVEEPASH